MLEMRLRELTGARNLMLLSNGTLALELALRALEHLGEVITTPFTFCASTQSIIWAGATPVFVDIDPVDLTIDPAAIEAAITPRTEAILGVHVYGRLCDLEAIESIAQKHGLAVIYDGARAFGSLPFGSIHRQLWRRDDVQFPCYQAFFTPLRAEQSRPTILRWQKKSAVCGILASNPRA